MGWPEWFERRSDTDQSVRCYLTDPRKSQKRHLDGEDKSAARAMAEAQELIDNLREYRQAIAKRYAEIEVMPYALELSLVRRVDYSTNKKYYDLTILKTYSDGMSEKLLSESYTGTERGKAFTRYAKLQKERPGILCRLDVAKGKWEK